ncbi:hypothetical protein QBC34DRAFT_174173 [Podospora aff. communis PSN243]|uniref:Uncharacterized protein n=1 Tax=Podospora aff. communis PSN243 TaxID=3040156 RepID=A0AAV9H017_9PEZI|nr:hypothetical protein QBC34DRAFT_174173 [Podospora aff. communis PSN243]
MVELILEALSDMHPYLLLLPTCSSCFSRQQAMAILIRGRGRCWIISSIPRVVRPRLLIGSPQFSQPKSWISLRTQAQEVEIVKAQSLNAPAGEEMACPIPPSDTTQLCLFCAPLPGRQAKYDHGISALCLDSQPQTVTTTLNPTSSPVTVHPYIWLHLVIQLRMWSNSKIPTLLSSKSEWRRQAFHLWGMTSRPDPLLFSIDSVSVIGHISPSNRFSRSS